MSYTFSNTATVTQTNSYINTPTITDTPKEKTKNTKWSKKVLLEI